MLSTDSLVFQHLPSYMLTDITSLSSMTLYDLAGGG